MDVTKDLLVELIYKSLPYSENITELNISYYSDAVMFNWRGNKFKIDLTFSCYKLEGACIATDDRATLIGRLVKKYYIDYLK